MAKRKSEKFKRIKRSTLARYLTEVTVQESIYNINKEDEQHPMAPQSEVPTLPPTDREPGDTESVYSAQTGVTQFSGITYATDALGITQDTMFLLLDLRDPEDYALWHIKESLNFPAPNIARDKTIPELFRFKNKPDKLIVIYMEDERKGTQAAMLFFEKGYENIFLLSGGIETFLEEFPHLVEGKSVTAIQALG